ncbi:MAG: site-specific DNA-methyltransferase [Verrucomicrobiota bacterium JB025]|nr:site-specific DNA-methyltransferase [Verrucomicrobiota bacterium JB025]
MDKLKLHSKDLTAENIEKLAALFPNCLTETKAEDGSTKHAIDFDLLRQELSADLVEGPQERYRLDWPGKREALATANAPIAKTLRPCREESVDFDSTKNLYIEGDNLEALKLLQETYLGKVKMIYIDPPYNTGNDFVYADDFAETSDEYFERSNQSDEEGNRLVANTDANGRFHSDWLTMIFTRLKVARNLLKDDGVVMISIDDNEAPNLRRICDEVFGAENFVSQIVWQRSKKGDAKLIARVHEYVICYARDKTACINAGVWRKKKEGVDEVLAHHKKLVLEHGGDHEKVRADMQSWYRGLPAKDPRKSHKHYNWSDDRGLYFPDNFAGPDDGRANRPRHDIPHPDTNLPCKKPSTGWRWDKKKTDWALAQEPPRIHFGSDHTTIPNRKSYLAEISVEPFHSIFYRDGRSATLEVEALVGKGWFQFPKNTDVLAELIDLTTNETDIILDFFSGSGSTGHAVWKLNDSSDSKRRFILVQLPEETGKEKYATIAEIGKERIRRAGAKIRAELEAQLEGELPGSDKHQEITAQLANLDTGFRVLKVDTSNMADVYYKPDEVTQDGLDLQVENIKPDRSPEDLLFQVLLDWGVDLALPIEQETIAGKTVFFVAENALAACFDPGLDEDFVKELAKREPLRAVFRDASFANDATRINIEQIFKALSPHTELKAI